MESYRDHTLLFFWSSIIFFLKADTEHCMMILLGWLNDFSKRKRFCSKERKNWVNIVHAYTHGSTRSSDVSVHCINKVMLGKDVSFGCEQSEWVTFIRVTGNMHVFPLDQVKSTNMVSHLTFVAKCLSLKMIHAFHCRSLFIY